MASLAVLRFGLKLMSLGFKYSKKFKKEIYNPEIGYAFNSRIQMTTRKGDGNIGIEFKDGTMKIQKGIIENPDITMIYRTKKLLAASISTPADETLDMLLTGDLYFIGNMIHLAKFSYLSSIFPSVKKLPLSKSFASQTPITEVAEKFKPTENVELNRKVDEVKYLNDPYMGKFTIRDYPNLMHLKNRWYSEHPWVCPERANNITDFFMKEGFEVQKTTGKPWHPGLRQGKMLKYLLTHKKPIIFEDDLLPGSTTSYRVGVQLFPEFGALNIWPELDTCHARELNPYHIEESTKEILNYKTFPYFTDRNIREQARKEFGNPISQQLEELWVLYFMWKTQAISHTIPDFAKPLELGLEKMIEEIRTKSQSVKDEVINFYEGMIQTLEGIIIYAEHLKDEVDKQVKTLRNVSNPNEVQMQRMLTLTGMSESLSRIPKQPAKTFKDAIFEVWIIWVALHQENMNAGLSLGRLDQILYPYFLHDMKLARDEVERDGLIAEMVELIGAFYFKCQDHLPLVPNVGNKLFGGSSSDQVITLGGVTPNGENGVNDLTYIFLKATELICLRDPNVNARYHLEKNSPEYLKRLCEVNINTTATPSIHNDQLMIESLVAHGFTEEDARNWSATGCVEPTSIGKHFGHTNCMMFNLVAALEILMNNGYHPLLHPKIGESTGEFTLENFPTFEILLEKYKVHNNYLIRQSIEYNNLLGITHQKQHPTPLLSALFEGPLEKGRDVVNGGAVYNSSGVAIVALADVVDSLFALKKLVYEWNKISLEEFKNAIDRDFTQKNDKQILEWIKQVPKFGSNDPETNQFAKELVDYLYNEFTKEPNYRGGEYFIGFWSMSNHVAFGKLSGTLPSGRLRGKAFTPGITPAPGSSDQLLSNIKTIAKIDHLKTPNNLAFNVKLVPSANDSHEKAVENFFGYTKSYMDLGGLQMQFNVVTTDTLRKAMKEPENYRWLMVRISGYNAYFTTLNKDMQIELIERMEFNT
jgi:pyruvate formate-lyase/glycerol dehydratase family glycyl radical enzyme